ncbi:hypothetical protein H5410_024166 [Solanum commersonii]|uniref:Uncharacterized protein n=1 Tax=Solanum commersonii TaxID=4109 RepID=A0A9J5ZL66_SOLCO|nr:hypothetical protein H5410_024166 [Solanum commersonii]
MELLGRYPPPSTRMIESCKDFCGNFYKLIGDTGGKCRRSSLDNDLVDSRKLEPLINVGWRVNMPVFEGQIIASTL